ncbi:MAG TPA: alpha-N-arabinofuranosidase, partial [Xylanibacter oryzae]|nr:alpha-N-arabinofuranosidase [Xylanibacter oryzae]
MNKLFTTLILLSAISVSSVADTENHGIIHADQGKQIIYKEIYGQFAEHLGSCIYGGLWV